jgi:hypothetical protein
MAATLNGGQLVNDSYALAGKIWYGGAYVDIVTRRQAEAGTGVPDPTMGPIYAFPSGGGGGTSPAPGGWYTVCGKFKTKFIDANNGDYATAAGEQEVPASFVKAEIRRTTQFPCGHQNPDLCSTQVWQGYLGSDGCVAFNPLYATKYQLKMYSELKRDLVFKAYTSIISYFDNNGIEKGVRTFHRSFNTPPSPSGPLPNSAYLTAGYQVTGNVAATVARLFSQNDIAGAAYNVHANIGCLDGNPGDDDIPPTDSCAFGDLTYIGPELVPGSLIPGDTVWKNVIAHELGHTAQRRMSGVPLRTYEFDENGLPCSSPTGEGGGGVGGGGPVACQPDDVTTTIHCRCEHVTASNRLDCLQSREIMSAANAEGFGHFMAARIWNDAAQSDCSFNYYKEFREPGGDKQPPYKVNCKTAVKWRDNKCFNALRGTEYDWLQFYWNVNTVGVNKVPLDDISEFHTAACGGDCTSTFVDWLSLKAAALGYYAGDPLDPQFANWQTMGNTFGVDENP